METEDNANLFNINIKNKTRSNKLTAIDIQVLNDNIDNLNNFFNLVLDSLCENKTTRINTTVREIVDKINKNMGRDVNNLFCMGRKEKNEDCKKYPKMFSNDRLIKIIYDLVVRYNSKKSLIHLVCKYDKETKTYADDNLQANVSIGGNPEGNSFINLRDILIENTKHETEIMCIQINDKQICYHNKPTTANKCDFCDKWQKDRELFKQLINEMLEQNQIINIIELMKDNLHLFPAAILDQDRYHYFHTSLEEYKKRLR